MPTFSVIVAFLYESITTLVTSALAISTKWPWTVTIYSLFLISISLSSIALGKSLASPLTGFMPEIGLI